MSGRRGGLDIGSRSIELVVLEGDEVVAEECLPTTPSVQADCETLLARHHLDCLVVTGYGRTLAEVQFGADTVTEIRAHARGVRHLFPDCRAVLDIGGQDMKAMALGPDGRVTKFEMNDRCAAGAGKFLEMMASALDYDLEAFGEGARAGEDGIRLSSMCAVFAESEVVGLVTRGRRREDIARAVHRSIAGRALGLLQRVSPGGPAVFTGGVARNLFMVRLLEEALGQAVHVPPRPHMTGALGAALLAAEPAGPWAAGLQRPTA